MELEKFPEVELLSVGCRIGDLADEDVGAQLFNLNETPMFKLQAPSEDNRYKPRDGARD